MPNWEYTTHNFKNQRDLEEHIGELGVEGWEMVSEKDLNGWIVGSFKRPVNSEDLSGLDSISNLISVLADPKKTQASINSLKEAYTSFQKAVNEQKNLQSKASENLKEIASREQLLETNRKTLQQDSSNLEKDKTQLAVQVQSHKEAVVDFNSKVTTHEAKVSSDLSSIASQAQVKKEELAKFETALTLKAKNLDSRENAILTREKEQEAVQVKVKQKQKLAEDFLNQITQNK